MGVRKMPFFRVIFFGACKSYRHTFANQIINVAWRDGKHAFACCRADYLCGD